MTAPADRVGRLTDAAARSCTSRADDDRRDDARVDAEFAAIVARNTERCDRPTGSTALRDQVGRIASALFCASGLDAELLAFAIRRAADHHAVDAAEVTDGIAHEVLRIAASLAAGR